MESWTQEGRKEMGYINAIRSMRSGLGFFGGGGGEKEKRSGNRIAVMVWGTEPS